jgi:hypothetical protein
MATRSRIAIEKEDGRVYSIYCHNDGYPEHNGAVLHHYYQDREKVERLIALGDISSLSEKVEPTGPHSFNSPERGVVVAYHRDRGKALRKAEYHMSKTTYFRGDVEEFGYLFTKENEWVYVSYGDHRPRKCSEI